MNASSLRDFVGIPRSFHFPDYFPILAARNGIQRFWTSGRALSSKQPGKSFVYWHHLQRPGVPCSEVIVREHKSPRHCNSISIGKPCHRTSRPFTALLARLFVLAFWIEFCSGERWQRKQEMELARCTSQLTAELWSGMSDGIAFERRLLLRSGATRDCDS